MLAESVIKEQIYSQNVKRLKFNCTTSKFKFVFYQIKTILIASLTHLKTHLIKTCYKQKQNSPKQS